MHQLYIYSGNKSYCSLNPFSIKVESPISFIFIDIVGNPASKENLVPKSDSNFNNGVFNSLYIENSYSNVISSLYWAIHL